MRYLITSLFVLFCCSCNKPLSDRIVDAKELEVLCVSPIKDGGSYVFQLNSGYFSQIEIMALHQYTESGELTGTQKIYLVDPENDVPENWVELVPGGEIERKLVLLLKQTDVDKTNLDISEENKSCKPNTGQVSWLIKRIENRDEPWYPPPSQGDDRDGA